MNFFKGLNKEQWTGLAGTAKVDAQFMATALAVYFTDQNLAGTVAAGYGFNVTDTGLGSQVVNVGSSGAAFEVASHQSRFDAVCASRARLNFK